MELFVRFGDVQGRASCLSGLGEIALAEGRADDARSLWYEELHLREPIGQPYPLPSIHQRLARLTEGAERADHVSQARAMWTDLGRPDLIAELGNEFAADPSGSM